MAYKMMAELSKDYLPSFYDSVNKSFLKAKEIMEKDARIKGEEHNTKKLLIAMLEDTEPHFRGAKQFCDEQRYGLTAEEMRVVDTRLRYTEKLIERHFPYRPECPVENIIQAEFEHINRLFRELRAD